MHNEKTERSSHSRYNDIYASVNIDDLEKKVNILKFGFHILIDEVNTDERILYRDESAQRRYRASAGVVLSGLTNKVREIFGS